jgi:hypothetical protein
LGVPANLSAAAPDEAQLAAAHAALLRTPGLQLHFEKIAAPPPLPGWFDPLLRAIFAALPVLKVVFWLGLATAAALVVWLLIRDLPLARRHRQGRAAAPADWRPEAQAARELLADADRLAAEGRFDEAVHLILFRSIDDIAGKRPGAVRPALTSRDLVETAPLSEAGRGAFRVIAEVVERSFFGGRPTDAAAFARCRREYEAFALAEGAA